MMVNKRRILIDGRTFSIQEKGGVSQMWAYLIGSEAWQSQLEIELLVYPGHEKNIHLQEALKGISDNYINLIKCLIPPSDNQRFSGPDHALQRISEVGIALRGNPQLVVNTYYGENVYPKCPQYFVTALDFAHEEIPELAAKPSTKDVIRRKQQAFSEATAISFISNSTRLVCNKYYRIKSGVKTQVIYLGHEGFEPDIEKVRGQILHVGTRAGYKNFSIVASAMAHLMARHSFIRFLVFGGEADEGTLARLSKLFPGRVIVRQKPTDQEIDTAMKMSSLFISASRYEGFGIPLLNALRFATIPIVSNIGVYRELAGNDALYFEPDSEESLIEAVDAGLKARSNPKGYWRIWNDVAIEYLGFFSGTGV